MDLRAWLPRLFTVVMLTALPAFASPGDCLARGANHDAGIDGTEVCPVSDPARPEEGSATVPDWRDIKDDVQRREWSQLVSAARSRPARQTMFIANLDTMVSLTRGSPVTTSLVDLRLAASLPRSGHREWVGIGLVAPVGVGVQPASTSYGDMAPPSSPRHAYADLGNLAFLAFWEPVFGRDTRLPVSLAVSLPTLLGTAAGRDDRVLLAASRRGFEDVELFLPGVAAFAPKLGLSQTVGSVEFTTFVKLSILLPALLPGVGQAIGVGSAQVMVRFVERPSVRLSGGLRAVGVVGLGIGPGEYGWEFGPGATEVWAPLASVAIEPRLEARVGQFELQFGVLLVVAHRVGGHDTFSHFLEAWGVRSSVGYRF